jgi:hypothetical protein
MARHICSGKNPDLPPPFCPKSLAAGSLLLTIPVEKMEKIAQSI